MQFNFFDKLKKIKVLIGASNGKIQMHMPDNTVLTTSGHKDRVPRLRKFPNSDLVLTCSFDSTIKLWDERNLTLMRTFVNQLNSSKNALEILSNETFACGSPNGIAFWSIYNETEIKSIDAGSTVYSLKMITNGILGSGQADGTVKLWNKTNGELIKTFKNHFSNVWHLERIDNETIVSASEDGNIIIRNFITGQLISNLTAHTDRVSTLKLISSDLIVTGSWDENIYLWNLTNENPIRTFQGHTGSIYGLDLLDDETLVSGSFDQTIKIWQISTGKLLRTINTGLNIWSLLIL